MLRNKFLYSGLSLGVVFIAVYSYFQLQEGTDVTVQENAIENQLLARFTLANLTGYTPSKIAIMIRNL
jgi:hypothetical protein